MHPAASPQHEALVERIKFARAALLVETDAEIRRTLLDQLGAATRELAELILLKEGRLRSPLE